MGMWVMGVVCGMDILHYMENIRSVLELDCQYYLVVGGGCVGFCVSKCVRLVVVGLVSGM